MVIINYVVISKMNCKEINILFYFILRMCYCYNN